MMNTIRVQPHSQLFTQVIALWRENARTLGFFPEGAFEEYVQRGWILASVDDSGSLVGYLMHRVARRGATWPRASIVHLCVDKKHRGQGVARELVEELRRIGRDHFLRIEARCRRDYEANSLWPNLGFVYAGEFRGRAGYPISIWRMDLRTLPLLDLIQSASSGEHYRAVLDSNVVFRIQDPLPGADEGDRHLAEEAKALEADWLPEEIGLCVTDELLNEIERNSDAADRRSRLEYARKFTRLKTKLEDVRKIESSLSAHFHHVPTPNTRSDIKQLAHAIVGSAHFFITQDRGLLSKSHSIGSKFDITILSPGEFIAYLDESLRDVDYQPRRLAGVNVLAISKALASDFADLYSSFRCNLLAEKKSHFESQLRRYLSDPSTHRVQLVRQENQSEHIALLVLDLSNIDQLQIPLLRISSSPLARTVVRHLLRDVVLLSARENRILTIVSDKCCQPAVKRALQEMGFVETNDVWVKCNLSFVGSTDELLSHLSRLRGGFPSVSQLFIMAQETLSDARAQGGSIQFAEVERMLWPAKIADAKLPSYVIPVKPFWAQHLFDEDIARQTLWGAQAQVALSTENVYYRSSRSSVHIHAPARLLWYVTDGSSYHGAKQIRACSRLNEVAVGSAKELFRRFRRLGIYQWHDVLRTANGDPHGPIMALRFKDTELFPNPLPLSDFRRILSETEGKLPFLQAPQHINPITFARIYKITTTRAEEE